MTVSCMLLVLPSLCAAVSSVFVSAVSHGTGLHHPQSRIKGCNDPRQRSHVRRSSSPYRSLLLSVPVSVKGCDWAISHAPGRVVPIAALCVQRPAATPSARVAGACWAMPCTLATTRSLAPRRCAPAAAHSARAVPCAPPARWCGATRCARAQRVAASATKGDSAGGGSSKPGVDDWISRWKERKSSGSAAPPPRSAEEVLTGPDPRTGYCYVFAGGLSKEACAFNALILRDALEPRGVLLHATQLMPPNGSPWTLRCTALSQRARHTRLLTRTLLCAAALCVPLRSRSRPWAATCRCGSSAPPQARWCVRCTRSATRRPWTRSS